MDQPDPESFAPFTRVSDCSHAYSIDAYTRRGAMQIGNRRSQFSVLSVDREHLAIKVGAPYMRGTYCLDRASLPGISIRRAILGFRLDFRPVGYGPKPLLDMIDRLSFFTAGPLTEVASSFASLGWIAVDR